MKRALAGLGLLLVLVLSACTGLPTTGYVNPGRGPEGDETQQFAFVPDGPQDDASPAEIVEGFLRAGSGPADDWATAKLFLAPGTQWDPRARVTIDRLVDRRATAVPDGSSVSVQLSTVAGVDANGAYSPAVTGAIESLSFALSRVDDQWRITSAPDGVVLYEEVFPTVYQAASVAYFDPTFSFIVPDVRWFPRPLVASRVTTALVDGQPSSWLAGAVRNAFPDELSLVGRSVTLSSTGVAQVQLPQAALSLDRTTLDRMQTQLTRSLVTAGISEVQMTVDGTPITATELPVKVTRVDPSPAVLTMDGTFGVLSGENVDAIPTLSDAVETLDPTSIELEADRSLAAVLTQQGTVASALADGRTFLLDDRPGLVAPSIDSDGAIWSVPRTAPSQVRAYTPEGVPRDIGNAWPDASEVAAFQISRDGTRIAAVVTVAGVREVWLAGIVREGTAISLGPPHVLSFSEPGAFDLSWLDDTTVGVLTSVDGVARLEELNVGGRGTVGPVPENAKAIAGGSASVRVLDDTGRLFSRRGSSWTLVATDIRVLAGQQGTTS
ncbi:LpqB family beta-propeller domain-containing protein [Microbacterium enclense]|uniref:LpqB family beta-propeller domain-containing protein n=1 Tax=Microbacterium enclense TaxID=993073 RepID=UPI0021A7064B|nr:LpqB family beta-propeller domain-containing protein [Microbacterium enclense]MCT2084657.1 LpqB family beta-propeller domain-containing protein [Microbacterium enclense]